MLHRRISNVRHMENLERKRAATINNIRDIVRKLEASLKYSRDLEAIRFLRYSISKSRNKVLTDDLRKSKIRNKDMLNLFRQSVTDMQLGSIDILPETLKRQVQRTWNQKYDALLLHNDQLKKQIIAMEYKIKEKQKQIDILQQKLLDIGGSIINSEGNTEKICRKCWILKDNI